MNAPTLDDFRKLRIWLQSIANQGLCSATKHDVNILKFAQRMGFIQLFGDLSSGQIIITAKGRGWLAGKID